MEDNEKLIDDALTAFADREIAAPSREHLRIALDAFEASLTRCGCVDCTIARRARTGITDHDRTALARALHELVYSPGANFDRAVPGVQEHMLACAEKVAAALPWVIPTAEVTLEVGEAHTPTDDEREALIALMDQPIMGASDGRTFTEMVVDAILAAGFRRSEEPSAGVRQVLAWIDHTLGLPMYQGTIEGEYSEGLVDTLKTVRKMLNGTTRPDASWRTAEPQGEPSDAPEHSYEAIRTDIISALAADGFAYLEAEDLVKMFEGHVVVRAAGGVR